MRVCDSKFISNTICAVPFRLSVAEATGRKDPLTYTKLLGTYGVEINTGCQVTLGPVDNVSAEIIKIVQTALLER